jgi:hypothetical protein
MLRKSSWWVVFACVAVACAGSSTEKQDRAWKAYANPQWGYCVSYPARWLKGDAYDGAGIYVKTGLKKFSRAVGEIDIGVIPDEAAPAVRTAPVKLVDDLETHFDGIKKFERAEGIEILEKREMQLVGDSALFTKDRYYDPQERAKWAEEIIFVRHKGALYRLELECRDDQLARFEPVFQRFVSTFRFDCN